MRRAAAILAVIVVSALLEVTAAAGPVVPLLLMSVEEEVAVGRRMHAQMGREVVSIGDRTVARYLRALGERLGRVAPGPKYPYRFSVVDDRTINAVALPGGSIWIHRGVLRAARNESQLVSVVAHEMAHVAQRHAARQWTNVAMAQWGLSLLGAFLGNVGGAGTAQVAAGLLTRGVFLEFSREDEREADRVGLRMMRRAGWDGRGMLELFELLRREQQRDPGVVEQFLSTHPTPQARIGEMRPRVTAGGRRNSDAFIAVKARLAASAAK